MSKEHVTINVRIKDAGESPVVEQPWAEPVLASEFGGDFRLLSDLLLAPLCRGDVVRCEVTADGSLQVVDISHIRPGLLIRFEHPTGTDATVKRVLKAARSLGHQVGRPFDGCAQFFVPGGELDRDMTFPRMPASWTRQELYDGPFRMRAALKYIDFTLATEPFANDIALDHKEPDDPSWSRLEPDLALPDA